MTTRTTRACSTTFVRFVGQRVAAVVGDSEAAGEEGCRRLRIDYELLPAVFDPEEAMLPGAPVIHDKGPHARIRDPQRNLVAEVHWQHGNIEAGFAEADFVHEGTYVSQRVQHATLETHSAVAWLDKDGRLNVRSSTQVPFLTRRALCDLFALELAKVRVFCDRVGGGFGGKQEMLVEDIVALATLRSGHVRLRSSSPAKSSSSARPHAIQCASRSRPVRAAMAH